MGREVAGEDLAVVADAHLAGKRKDVEGAPDFIERVRLRDAEFQRDDVGNLLLAGGQRLRGRQQDFLPLVARELRLIGGRDRKSLSCVFGAAGGYGADDSVVPGIADFYAVVRVDKAAGYSHRFVAHRDYDLRLRHSPPSAPASAAAVTA